VDLAGTAAVGTLAFVDNTVDSTTGTVRLRATFPNKDKTLWPGQYVTASVTLNETQNAIVVPSQAVQTGPKGQYVYVVKAGTAQMREVTVERVDGAQTVVAKGLVAGEQIVTSGQSRLIPGMKVSIKPDEKKK
jgi:multidrug efflux system membrane fusion protein